MGVLRIFLARAWVKYSTRSKSLGLRWLNFEACRSHSDWRRPSMCLVKAAMVGLRRAAPIHSRIS